ncbi:hypothetical protein SLS63_013189 [Diaporthe eres]|uniref:Aflatoxin regulatory protein domain-containing protein n=1 Tax=Diaporthe eres TaxID=83184 RepID=A0ABR1NP84_DIAER
MSSDSFRPSLPELDMDMDVLMTCIGGGPGPKNNNGSRAASTAAQGGGRPPLVADCVGSTIAIQEQLEATNERLRLPGTMDPSGLLAPAVEVLGTACDRLATVLVCPCSAQLGTGLLVATACVSMLDVYRAMLLVAASAGGGRGSSRSPSFGRADPPGNDGSGGLFEQGWGGVPDYFSVSSSSGASHQGGRRLSLAPEEQQLPGGRQGEAVMRIMEALPRAASLILQFAKRYKASDSTSSLRGSCAAAQGSSELLYALAAYLRVRLQRLTSEATEQLQCASWAGGI